MLQQSLDNGNTLIISALRRNILNLYAHWNPYPIGEPITAEETK